MIRQWRLTTHIYVNHFLFRFILFSFTSAFQYIDTHICYDKIYSEDVFYTELIKKTVSSSKAASLTCCQLIDTLMCTVSKGRTNWCEWPNSSSDLSLSFNCYYRCSYELLTNGCNVISLSRVDVFIFDFTFVILIDVN